MPSMGMDSSGLNSELVAFSSDLQDKESKYQQWNQAKPASPTLPYIYKTAKTYFIEPIGIKGFGGLTYLTIKNVPIKETEFGDVIDLASGTLEQKVAVALIDHKIPVRGAEFRVMKSALGISNEAIAQALGISRNTVLKWGKEIEKRLSPPYEMLFRLLVSETLGIGLAASLEDLKAADKAKVILLNAA
jgi:DNA-binding transcriptional regulator YiaG